MKLLNRAGLAMLGALLLPAVASAAAPAYVAGTTNLRAGPGTEYPIVARIGSGSRVTVHGCIRGYDWCDATIRGFRGWVTAARLEFVHRGRRVLVPQYYRNFGAPVVSFNFGYWDRHYTDRPFFRERGRWDHNWRGRGDDDRDRRGSRRRGSDDGERRGGGGRGDQENRVERGPTAGDGARYNQAVENARRNLEVNQNAAAQGQAEAEAAPPPAESAGQGGRRGRDGGGERRRRDGSEGSAAAAAEGGAERNNCFMRNGREICR